MNQLVYQFDPQALHLGQYSVQEAGLHAAKEQWDYPREPCLQELDSDPELHHLAEHFAASHPSHCYSDQHHCHYHEH
jgi:hypothetical protein